MPKKSLVKISISGFQSFPSPRFVCAHRILLLTWIQPPLCLPRLQILTMDMLVKVGLKCRQEHTNKRNEDPHHAQHFPQNSPRSLILLWWLWTYWNRVRMAVILKCLLQAGNQSVAFACYKGSTSKSIAAGRLLRLVLSIQQQTRRASSLLPLHIKGKNNAMADISSRAL